MLAAAFASALLVGAVSSPVFAVNDKFVPAEDCAPPNSEAVGHPAAAKEQSPKASAPFSDENPGESSGAKAVDKEQASC
jgi:hypothetical protein